MKHIIYSKNGENEPMFWLVDENGEVTSQSPLLEKGEKTMHFSAISRHLRWLQGEILTILEATIDDERKLNATKSIVKDKFNAKISWIYELCGAPEENYGLSSDTKVEQVLAC